MTSTNLDAQTQKLVAVAEGYSNDQGNSVVYIYDVDKKSLRKKYRFHQRGVQSMSFSVCCNFLFTVGVQGEDLLAVYELSSGTTVDNKQIKAYSTNQVKVDPFYITGRDIRVMTCGNDGSFIIWNFDTVEKQFQSIDTI